MSPLQIVQKAATFGVSLHLTEKNSIAYKGQTQFIDEILPLLRANKRELMEWLEFHDLYECLATKNLWVSEDYHQWCKDLGEQPILTMACLRSLKRSWDRCGYGCLTQAYWVSGETKN